MGEVTVWDQVDFPVLQWVARSKTAEALQSFAAGAVAAIVRSQL
jgi:hypothetical protein